MKRSVENVRFQLEINGRPVCTSGIDNFGVLSAIVNWVKRDPSRFDPARHSAASVAEFSREALRIEFGGFDSSASPERHLSWHQQELKVGDVVSIRVLGRGLIDEPI
jgi:hypothetical protein